MGRTQINRQHRRTLVIDSITTNQCPSNSLQRKQEEEHGDGEEIVLRKIPPASQQNNDASNEDQSMSQAEEEGDDEIGSIPTTSAVRTYGGDIGFSYFHTPLHRRANSGTELQVREFVIPQTPAAIAAAAAEANQRARVLQRQEYYYNDDDDDDNDNDNDNAEGDDADDISILTEFSGMDEDEDASSQLTTGTEARTVVTTTTGSTTIPTRNINGMNSNANFGGEASTPSNYPQYQQFKVQKRRNAAVSGNKGFPPLDNSQFKRRRKL